MKAILIKMNQAGVMNLFKKLLRQFLHKTAACSDKDD